MFLFYKSLTTFLYPILILLIFLRKFLDKEHNQRYKEKIFINHFNVSRKNNTKLVWFHAASIGEFKSILPIIKKLNKENDNFEFLITTLTLTSSKLVNEEFKNIKNVYHRFLPVDVNFIIEKFIELWKPKVVFLVDSEIWPNLISSLNKNKIPIALINARLTTKTFNRWKLIPKSTKYIFNLINLFLCSNLETKKYLEELKIKNVYYTGNIKLISVFDNEFFKKEDFFLKDQKLWLASSTHYDEEDFCLKIHLRLKKEFKNLITVIAPRHINRVTEIKNLCDRYKLRSQILNKQEQILKDKNIIIINSFGDLLRFYKYALSVFVGKSMVKKLKNDSGQNPIEAAKHGCKIYHGPFVSNFKDIYDLLRQKKISRQINNAEELYENLVKDLQEGNKETEKFSDIMTSLSKETEANTMKKINTFLSDAI